MRFFKRTKEPTEMQRLLENIAQTENEIRGRIYQLGEMFYQVNKTKEKGEMDEQYYAIIELINRLEQNRRGCYKNKQRLEGHMMCEHCGAMIPYGSIFCNICGQRAEGQTPVPVLGAAGAASQIETQVSVTEDTAPVIPSVGTDTALPIPLVEIETAGGSAVHKCS